MVSREKAVEWFVAPAIVGLVTGAVLLIVTPVIVERYELRNPTCDDPRGLVPVKGTPTVSASSSANEEIWCSDNAVDGNTGTVWVPKREDVSGRHAFIEFTFSRKEDLKLICIVNGHAQNDLYYLRANRIRAAQVSTREVAGRGNWRQGPLAPVRSLGQFEFLNRQPLRFEEGEAEQVKITIESVYNGQTVYEPFPNGRLKTMKPSLFTALSEVEFYTREPSDWWEFWR